MLTLVWIVAGMLAGAAVLTGLLFLIYAVIGCGLFGSDTMFWLMIPNFCVGPFAGAALGLIIALHFCGFPSAARTAAIPAGCASLAFIYAVYAFIERKNWPGVYTLHQGAGVVLRCAGETVGVCFCIVPLPCLVGLCLIILGITRH